MQIFCIICHKSCIAKIYISVEKFCDHKGILEIYKARRKKRLKKRIFFILSLVLIFLFCFGIYLKKVARPIILMAGREEVRSLVVSSCNNAILNISTISYDDIVSINYKNGKIQSIVADTSKINAIANALAIETQKELALSSDYTFSVPLGTLSGISFLSGKGSKVSFSISPIGYVKCKYHTSFESAGINQTSHKIFVTICATASLILPFYSENIQIETDYLICECVIVGEVPSVYLNGSQKLS